MTNEELHNIAKELDNAELGNTVVLQERVKSINLSKEDGYKIAVIRSKNISEISKVWKLAGSDICGFVKPENTMICENGEVKLTSSATHSYQVEVEIALKTAIDISSDIVEKELPNNELFASLHLAMEMPAFRISTPITPESQGWLIADNAGAGAFAVSKELPLNLLENKNNIELSNEIFKLYLDGKIVAEGNASTLWDNQINIARNILPYIIQQCGILPKGSYITTGGIIGGTPIDSSSTITAEWDGIDKLTLYR